jgi:hypothetical protein
MCLTFSEKDVLGKYRMNSSIKATTAASFQAYNWFKEKIKVP